MTNITFAGIEGEIIESSPHSSFLVVKLSDRITICGAVINKFDWDIAEDKDSGFESFITYVGVRSQSEANQILPLFQQNGGYFGKDGSKPRKSKRCLSHPLELKIRGLEAEFVVDCINEGLIG